MKSKKVLTLAIFTPLLISCGKQVPFVFEEYDHSFALINTHEELSSEDYYRPSEQGKITLRGKLDGTVIEDLYSFKKVSESKYVYNPLKGDVQDEYHLLVVPIAYLDSETHNNASKQADALTRIQNSFFGSKEHNSYYSVSEYYQRSSYGHVRLTGEVTPFYELDKRAKDLENTISVVETIAADVIGYLNTQTSIDLNQYDNDDDGYIDGIYLIYDHPSQVTKQETDLLFWQVTDKISKNATGYTHNIGGQSVTYKNDHSPYMCDFSWSSLDCAGNDTISDSNYYIHEVGHLFGLEDYYNTGSGFYQPTGFLDMMDYNLGDHTAFSKYLLNWTSPTVILDSCSLKLTPFQEKGEFFLIPANPKRFNKEPDHPDDPLDPYYHKPNPYDEYLLLEFFAPKNLNDSGYFSSYRYTNKDGDTKIFSYPDIYGLKIYHVDARLAYFSNARFNEKVGFIYEDFTPAQLETCKYVNYAYHNETSKYNENVPVLYHLLERSGDNTFINNNSGSNKTFFQPGDHFGSSVFKDFKFHDGSELGFTFKYSKFSTSGITIDFYKK